MVFVALMLTAALLFTLFGIRRELVSDKEGFVEYIVYGPGWGWGPRWGPRWGRNRWWWRRYHPYGPPPGYWYSFW